MTGRGRQDRADRIDTTTIVAPDVAAVFAGYADPVRSELMVLRRLILDTADELEGVAAIEETLRWGQPAYLTAASGSGSTIRIAPTPTGSPHDYAMYFICRTSLVATFRRNFGAAFSYEGDRALLFTIGDTVPVDELRECVAMALIYHLSKV